MHCSLVYCMCVCVCVCIVHESQVGVLVRGDRDGGIGYIYEGRKGGREARKEGRE